MPSRRALVTGGFLLLLLALAWATRYRVVEQDQQQTVLYDRWMHRMCYSDPTGSGCLARLP